MLYWMTSIASLIGVWLNIKKHVACFYIWTATNAIWAYVDLKHEIYPQAALQSIYFLMAIYGVCIWSRCRVKSNKKVTKIKE